MKYLKEAGFRDDKNGRMYKGKNALSNAFSLVDGVHSNYREESGPFVVSHKKIAGGQVRL